MKRLSATLAASILAITMIAGQCTSVFAGELNNPPTGIENVTETTTAPTEITTAPAETTTAPAETTTEAPTETPAETTTETTTEAPAETTTETPAETTTEALAEAPTAAQTEPSTTEPEGQVSDENLVLGFANSLDLSAVNGLDESGTNKAVVDGNPTEGTTTAAPTTPAENTTTTAAETPTEGTTTAAAAAASGTSSEATELSDGGEYVLAYRNEAGDLIALTLDENGNIVGTKISGYEDATDAMKWKATSGSKGVSLLNSSDGKSYLYYDDTTITTTDQTNKASWSFSEGSLGYEGKKGKKFAGSATSDGVAYGDDKISSYVLLTASGEEAKDEATENTTTADETETTTAASDKTSSSSVTYTETNNLDDYTYISLVDPSTGNALKLDMNTFQSATTTVTGDAGSRTASATKGTSIQVKKVGDGYALLMSDPPGTWNYINVDGGTLAKDSDSTAEEKYNKWNLDADGHLYYDDNGTKYYLNSDGTVGTEYDGASILLGGTEAASAGSGGGKGGNSIVSNIKADGPQVVSHPEATNVEYDGSNFEAPRYSTTAALPEGSTATSITFKWYVNNTLVATNTHSDAAAGVEITDVFQVDQLKGVTAGVYPVYCEVSCTIAGEDGTETEYTNTAATVNFIVCKGIRSNTALTFSDVHEGFDSIRTAISNVMGDEGLIPALIICTGDWANGHYSGAELDSEGYNTTLNTFISRLKGQAGGIDTVFVSGNHDSGEAAITASIDADLGAAEDYDGVGVIYDSAADTESVGTSEADDGLIVFGINYENIEGENGTDYDNIYDDLATFLSDLRDDYAGQLVVISAHAGLHQLEDWSGEAAYNINNANKIVALLNEYAETGMNILYMFGHNHSKGESELALVPGDEITTVISYTDKTTETVPISFAYGHAGYLLQGTGSGAARYSLISWDTVKDTFTKDVYGVTDGAKIDDLSYTVEDDKLIVHDFTFTEGNGSKWTGDANGLKFEVNGDADTFTSLKIDGKEVDPKDYTIAKGCTEITLSAAYLKQLASGEKPHTIEANYESGSAVAAFFVDNKVEEVKPAEPESKADQPEVKPADGNKPAGGDKPAMGPNSDIPKTGDTNNALIWIIIMVACAACIVTVFTCLIRRNRKNR